MNSLKFCSQRQALKTILRHSQHSHCHLPHSLKAISTVRPIFISFSKSFKTAFSAHYLKELKVTWSVLSQDEKRDRQGKCFIYALKLDAETFINGLILISVLILFFKKTKKHALKLMHCYPAYYQTRQVFACFKAPLLLRVFYYIPNAAPEQLFSETLLE